MAPQHYIKREIIDGNLSSDSSCDSNKRNSKQRKTEPLDKGSDEYRKRRERNNLAVKKSRSKSKLKTQQTVERVNQLREENEKLETKIKLLTKELSFLKDLFLAHAGSVHGNQNLSDVDLNFLNDDDCPEKALNLGTRKNNP